jgi:hypothetical protein
MVFTLNTLHALATDFDIPSNTLHALANCIHVSLMKSPNLIAAQGQSVKNTYGLNQQNKNPNGPVLLVDKYQFLFFVVLL